MLTPTSTTRTRENVLLILLDNAGPQRREWRCRVRLVSGELVQYSLPVSQWPRAFLVETLNTHTEVLYWRAAIVRTDGRLAQEYGKPITGVGAAGRAWANSQAQEQGSLF